MNEFEFIDNLDDALGKSQIELSIGDDAACFNDVLIAKDIMVEDVHFTSEASIQDIIFKLFTCNVSDIAAMGGTAENVLLGLSIPSDRIDNKQLIDAIKSAAKHYGVNVIGGDTTSSLSSIFLSLTVTGRKGEHLLKRNGAKVGDIVCLSRPIGFGSLGLIQELESEDFGLPPFLHYRHTAEKELGTFLGNANGVTSCIDISDGLGRESTHIAKSSGVKLVINAEQLPIEELSKYSEDPVSLMLESGEEFALLFTVNKHRFNDIRQNIFTSLGRDIIEIGVVREGDGEAVLKTGEQETSLSVKGYEHKI